MHDTLMRTIPFIEARYAGKKQRPKSLSLVLSNTTSEAGAAYGIANYWHNAGWAPGYAHYIVDEKFKFQTVPNDVQVSERGVVRINVCGVPQESSDTWIIESGVVLENAAQLVADLCWTYGIPARDIGLLEHRRRFRRGGIMIDVQGAWPKEYFYALVRDYLKTYKAEGGL